MIDLSRRTETDCAPRPNRHGIKHKQHAPTRTNELITYFDDAIANINFGHFLFGDKSLLNKSQ